MRMTRRFCRIFRLLHQLCIYLFHLSELLLQYLILRLRLFIQFNSCFANLALTFVLCTDNTLRGLI